MAETRSQAPIKGTVAREATAVARETAAMGFRSYSSYADLNRLEKVDFPRFNGGKITDWLFMIEQFFLIDRTPEELKVGLASIHFDDIVATLHQSIVQSMWWKHVRHDWWSYKLMLQVKYNQLMDDSIAKLKQLQEVDGIDKYHARFELISTRVNLSEAFLVSAYLTGLQIDTQINVRMFRPQSIQQCLMLGRLYEKAHQKKLIIRKDGDDYRKGVMPLNVSRKATGTSKSNDGICMIDNDEDRFLSGSGLVENEVEKVKNDLVDIDVAKSCVYEQFSDNGGVFGFNIEECKTDSSSQARNELCTKKEEEVKGWIQEQANNHSTNSLLQPSLVPHMCSLLKQQVSIPHLEFSHRSPIGSVDVYEDLSAIVRSQFDLECAASIALQVFHSMPLRTKLLQNLRKKRLSKTWWFKFKEIDVMQEDVQHVVLSFLQMSAIKTRYDIGDHDEMFTLMSLFLLSEGKDNSFLDKVLNQQLEWGDCAENLIQDVLQPTSSPKPDLIHAKKMVTEADSILDSTCVHQVLQHHVFHRRRIRSHKIQQRRKMGYAYSIREQNGKWKKLLRSKRLVNNKLGCKAKTIAEMSQYGDQPVKMEFAK